MSASDGTEMSGQETYIQPNTQLRVRVHEWGKQGHRLRSGAGEVVEIGVIIHFLKMGLFDHSVVNIAVPTARALGNAIGAVRGGLRSICSGKPV